MLLEFEADPSARNNRGETPLHWSGRYALGDIDVMVSLAHTGVDLNAVDEHQRTLLHHICSNRSHAHTHTHTHTHPHHRLLH